MGILGLIAQIAHFGHQMIAILIEIPIFLARHIGVMGVGEAHGQTPGAVVFAPRQIIDFAGRIIGNLVVILELVGDLGHTSAGHRPHIVIPPVDPLAGFAVIRCPAEVARIDICGQTFFKAMQLIWSDEMHLA